MDIISEALRAIRLTATVYFHADFFEPWGMDIKGGRFANFHIVSKGRCWLGLEGEERQVLEAGDLVLLPHGSRHVLSGQRNADAPPAEDVLNSAREGVDGRPEFGGPGQLATTLLCGHFEYERAQVHPLIATLPRMVLLKKSQQSDANWIESICELAIEKSRDESAGTPLIVDRLAETMLIGVLREYARLYPEKMGFWTAARSSSVSPAILAVHQSPAHPWSVGALAKLCSLSESAFAHRFRELVDISPMRYVTIWRMHKAHDLLMTTDRTLASISTEVGYASEWAFSKAFKREYGETPDRLRRV